MNFHAVEFTVYNHYTMCILFPNQLEVLKERFSILNDVQVKMKKEFNEHKSQKKRMENFERIDFKNHFLKTANDFKLF